MISFYESPSIWPNAHAERPRSACGQPRTLSCASHRLAAHCSSVQAAQAADTGKRLQSAIQLLKASLGLFSFLLQLPHCVGQIQHEPPRARIVAAWLFASIAFSLTEVAV